MDRIAAVRAQFALAIAAAAQLRSVPLRMAFATVPREAFLRPGPWLRLQADGHALRYECTPNADAVHVYVDAPIAIDPHRGLNNGQPSFVAACIDELDIAPGDRVVHVGCGTGYFTAIIARTAGPRARVTAVELDAGLASQARANLAAFPQVDVVEGDGATTPLPVADAVFVNAGTTHVVRSWLDALADRGRLVVPLTAQPLSPGASVGYGHLLKVTRRRSRFAARFVSTVGIYHCIGARDPVNEDALRKAFAGDDPARVQSVRLDAHAPDRDCLAHGDGTCLSMRVAAAD